MTEPATETRGFQTEARKLLSLMINSLYSNREIFLRELISNASDAIDRLRFAALEDDSLIAEDPEFRIVVSFDKDAGTVSVSDNGIGMSRDDAIAHLGTIAKSGTEEFLSRLTGDQRKDSALIGQFGVGFYSSFIVAKEVEVLTRRAGEAEGTRWTSTGEEEFTVATAADAPRGTCVTLHLKPAATEFADGFRLRAIVRRYSDHIGVPVMMAKAEDAEAGDDKPKIIVPGEGGAKSGAKGRNKDAGAPALEAVNSAKALWTRPRKDVKPEEYKEFYKHVSHDFEDPAAWSHNRVEGKLEYTSLLYVPARAPFDLWNREVPRGLKLYVQRVFILDEADQFLPLYLRFVRGVVDANDLPLNVSRELLQEDDRVRTMKSAIAKRALAMLDGMAEEDYAKAWDEFGQVLKEGIGEDFANRDALLGLMRFASTQAPDAGQRTSLKNYIGRAQAAGNGAVAAEGGAAEGGAAEGGAAEGGAAEGEAAEGEAAEGEAAEGKAAEGEGAKAAENEGETDKPGDAADEDSEDAATSTAKDGSGTAAKQSSKIYYLIADSLAAARQSPHLEVFRQRGIEVLLLTDRIDEWWMSFVDEYEGIAFQDVARGELALDQQGEAGSAGDAKAPAGEDADKAAEEAAAPLIKRIGAVLDGKVEGVRRSTRLTDSPACLVLGEHDLGSQMRRILEAAGQTAPEGKPHFEINMAHPLIARLDQEADEDRFQDLVSVLFDQAALAEGNPPKEPGAYVQRVNKLLVELLAS